MPVISSFIRSAGLVGLWATCAAWHGALMAATSTAGPPPAVEVSALDFTFLAPDSLPGGWVTLKMKNEGRQEHFLSLYRLPPGKDFAAFSAELLGPFSELWNTYARGEIGREEAWARLFTDLPDWWFEETVHTGGPALTEAGETTTVTVYLEPGHYVMECYVKTPEGKWHTELGMMRELSVTDPTVAARPPEPDVTLVLRNYTVEVQGTFRPGPQIVAVTAADTPEGFARHDINLFRLGEDDDVRAIAGWMDWMDFGQFRAPAPGYSLGGMEAQAAGRTGYVTLDLKPGRYVWISEEYGRRGMIYEFTVE